jgi:hypothetical protein
MWRAHSLSARFQRAAGGSQHVLIHGESGSGKSWLYKRTLHHINALTLSANLANASRLGSIAAEIEAVTAEHTDPVKTQFSETKSAAATAWIASGSLSHTAQFDIPNRTRWPDPSKRCETRQKTSFAAWYWITLKPLSRMRSSWQSLAKFWFSWTALGSPTSHQAYSRWRAWRCARVLLSSAKPHDGYQSLDRDPRGRGPRC